MEHRHDRHHHIGGADREAVLLQGADGVDDGAAVAVEHALRLAGGARGVAERGGAALVQLRPVELRGLAGDEAFLGQQLEAAAQRAVGRDIGLAAHDDDGAEAGRQLVGQGRGAGQQGRVDQQVGVLGIRQDEGDLAGEEARVHGVQHRAHGGDAVVGFQVVVLVPGEGRDAFAALHAARRQGMGELGGAGGDLGPAVAHQAAVGAGGDDPGAGVVAGGVIQEAGDQQRSVLHQAQHLGCLPVGVGRSLRGRGGGGKGARGWLNSTQFG